MIQININWIVKINSLGVYGIYVFILRIGCEDVYIYIYIYIYGLWVIHSVFLCDPVILKIWNDK